MALELYVVGAAVLVGALPVGGKLGFQEVAEVLSEGGFFRCEGEVHDCFEGVYLYGNAIIEDAMATAEHPIARSGLE